MIISTIVDMVLRWVVCAVYTDLIISTIVDCNILYGIDLEVYTDLIISTIVDNCKADTYGYCLYGLDNFYYRRYSHPHKKTIDVYTDLIISTIVDSTSY